jgi:hypothetical protein
MLAAGGLDNDVDVWDARTGERRTHLDWEGTDLLSWSPNGSRLAVGGAAGRAVALWNPLTGSTVVLGGHRASVWTAAWSPAGSMVATAEAGGAETMLWDASTGVVRVRLPHAEKALWSPSGTQVLTYGICGSLYVWDVRSAAKVVELRQGPGHGNSEAAWSPDGELVACSGGTEVRLWNPATAHLVASLTGHGADVLRLRWSPDGRTLLVVTFTESVVVLHRVWDGARVRLHAFGPSLLAYTPAGLHCGDAAAIDHVRVRIEGGASGPETLPAHEIDPQLLCPTLLTDFFSE